MEVEEWRSIPGYEGFYEASNLGRIKSLSRIVKSAAKNNKGYVRRRERILKQCLSPLYFRISYSINGIRGCIDVHRLICSAFHPNPENKPHVNHKDGNKLNNRADNLEWNSEKENTQHAIKNHLVDDHPNRGKMTLDNQRIVYAMRKDGKTQFAIADYFGVHQSVISRILNRKRSYYEIL